MTSIQAQFLDLTAHYAAYDRLKVIFEMQRVGQTIFIASELLPVSRTPGLGVLVGSGSDDGTAQGIYA